MYWNSVHDKEKLDDDSYSTDCIAANVEVYIYLELIGMCLISFFEGEG